MNFQFFATCPRGLEALLADELLAQRALKIVVTDGGVSFEGSLDTMYRVNLHSRIATRIMSRVGQGSYATEEDIYKATFKLHWPSWFKVNQTIRVKVTGVKCPLKSLDFVTLRIKDAVCDRFREEGALRPSVSVRDPDVRIHAYLTQDQYQLYLDTSGAPLYQRGFRDVSVIAPLRENLAAGIIMLSGWIPGTPFLDPMCGSGTFLIEAAMMAVNQPPGMKRTFGFQKLTSFDEGLWKRIETEAMNKMKPIEFLDIYGSDMDLRAVRVARHNLKVAGLEEVAKVMQSDFIKLEPPASEGTLVTNPPYGQRIGEDEDLKEVYPVWAKHMKESFGGWNTYFLTADLEMPKDMRLKPSKKTPLYNGALECRLFEIKMVAGSNRKPKD
ncbi:THUMP domain-containing class I SAM-dependent RNA methyltransferase [Candidatus Methylopumilus universalis]|uniref:THUMP domain-containing class I SAM-dependent RNA methyltransferase n=1 Tax=Candidatus Methylopumilus universalis TaxID=2588536 RepID=UPI00112338F1|nr:class I SAM-dependent RNA methyltransferase [Candidatus Methylopumilus universalis]QDC80402.1 class I SAM-dependent RNA methyltransferase [Candidatus Methylopumilus universalis]QDC81703.1 class I SAM-dependent RNA methyltransferase [Candidatus Methylopumilus universalis]QDC88145.1 class I SAM-dependent RNA methyltransferase [Candidatus Methylopumilus universalis]